MAIEITDEMRRAVLEQVCADQGHTIDPGPAVSSDNHARYSVKNADPGKLPHLRCIRCDRTWIVIDEAGTSYEDAEEKLRGRVKDPAFIDERREKRKPTKP